MKKVWDIDLDKWRKKVKEISLSDLGKYINELDDTLAHQQRFGLAKNIEKYYERRIVIAEKEWKRRK